MNEINSNDLNILGNRSSVVLMDFYRFNSYSTRKIKWVFSYYKKEDIMYNALLTGISQYEKFALYFLHLNNIFKDFKFETWRLL